ncbi:MAG: hypothetical protein P8105_06040 [Dehalococcoidia bacterium]|jgi:hypothetical protein
MLHIILGIFFILHGLVHLLYAGQSLRMFELQSGMVWPDGSWAFKRLLNEKAVRVLGGALCLLATDGFVIGSILLFLSHAWWRPVIAGSAIFSSVVFILLWDGKMQALHNKGLIGILINLAILIIVLGFGWTVI